MIYINKNAINIFGLDLSNSKLFSPCFLFEIKSNGAKKIDTIIFIAPDLSEDPQRMSSFQLVEGENGSETFGNAYLELPINGSDLKLQRGQYTYKVYESETIVQTVEETTGEVLRVGLFIVEPTEDEEDKGQNFNERNIYA